MERAGFLLRTRRIKYLFGTVSFALFALLPYSFLTPAAAAATATVTTLTVTPSNSLAAQQIATLTASVQAGGQAVTVGTVSFYDGKLYLGSFQVVRDASHGYAVGTATLKTALSVGTHTLAATFLPTATYSSSTSAGQTVTVSGPGTTSVALSSAAGSGNSTSFTTVLSAFGSEAPTGSISFSNQTSNSTLGTADLNSTAFARGFSPLTPFTAQLPEFVYASDLNGDGFPDLLVVENPDVKGTRLQPFIGKGDGTFTAGNDIPQFGAGGGSPPIVADYNGDGIVDVAFSSNIDPTPTQLEDDGMNVVLGAGDGTYPTNETLLSPSGSGNRSLNFAAEGDFNGDGIPDLTVTDTTSSTSPTLYIFPGKGDGTFGTSITSSGLAGMTSLVVQDFNGDGYADMAVTLSGQNAVLILLGKGDGTFLPAVSYSTGNTPVIATMLQSRGNGVTDLAIWNQADNTLGILLGKGDGTFQPQVTHPVSVQDETPEQFIAADVTGDGLQDIVALYVPNTSSTAVASSFSVFAGNGDGTYQAAVNYAFPVAGIYPPTITSADFNRDGIPDLMVPNPGGYTINALLSSQQGSVPLAATVYGNGTQQVAAEYSGDSNYSSSISNSIPVTGQGNAPAPTFTFAASPSSLSIPAGKTGTATLTVTPQNGYSGTLQFSCSGLPANSSCSFSPSSLTPNGAAATTTLTLATNVQVAADQVPERPSRNAVLSFAFLLGIGFLGGSRRAGRRLRQFSTAGNRWMPLFLAVALALGAALILGCGGNGSNSGGSTPTTPVGTTNVTVTAVDSGSTSLSQTTVLTVAITN